MSLRDTVAGTISEAVPDGFYEEGPWARQLAADVLQIVAQRVRHLAAQERDRRSGYTQVLVYERAIRDVLHELEGVA